MSGAGGVSRRGVVLGGVAVVCPAIGIGAAASARSVSPVWLRFGEPIAQLAVADGGALLALSRTGRLWRLDSGGAPRQIGDAIDVATPLATGHGQVAARRVDGSLWILNRHGVGSSAGLALAPSAGLLILPLGVIAVAEAGESRIAVRVEPSSDGVWRVVDRSVAPLLPDARPLQAALDGEGDAGHVVVLAGPDDHRYRHGVLGDAIEATRLLYLERHGLSILREWHVPEPFVIEDIAPRRVGIGGRDALLTVLSGPRGARLVLVGVDPADRGGLAVLASGEPLGAPSRWLAPTTDGRHWLAVHTPHIGGVLHRYRRDGALLVNERMDADHSNHRIGSRLLDMGSWTAGRLLLPCQTGTRLDLIDVAGDGRALVQVDLPAPAAATVAWAGGRHAVLTADGRVGSLSFPGH